MLTEPTGTALPVLAQAAWDRLGDDLVTVFEGRRWTASELGRRSQKLASGLIDRGVEPGDRVVVCLPNCVEVGVTYHAIWRAAGVVTPVLFVLSEDELRHVLTDSGARLVVTSADFLPKVAAAAAGALDVQAIVVLGEAADQPTAALPPAPSAITLLPFDELEDGPEAPVPVVDSAGLAALLYTGGTTGRSKGVMISHDALSAAGWSTAVTSSAEDLTVSLQALPLAHIYGLMVSTMQLHLTYPMTSVLMRWFDAEGWLRLAQAERANVSPVVPTMLRVLLDQPLEHYDLSALRRLTSGSAPLPAEVRRRWNERVPHVEVVEGYGCTETSGILASTRIGRGRPGSVGIASPISTIGIAVGQASLPTDRRDVDGEICVQSPTVMSGYWKSPVETALAMRDGWFHTGDVGHLDADGYLFVVDRIKDVIIRDGFNVYPRDVEEALIKHPDVANCAVVGRPDERHGEEVVAFVQLRPGAATTTDAIRDFAKAHLSAVKYPRDVRVVEQVPLTNVGKLDRKRLRSLLVEGALG